jgi:hypothetical protein
VAPLLLQEVVAPPGGRRRPAEEWAGPHEVVAQDARQSAAEQAEPQQLAAEPDAQPRAAVAQPDARAAEWPHLAAVHAAPKQAVPVVPVAEPQRSAAGGDQALAKAPPCPVPPAEVPDGGAVVQPTARLAAVSRLWAMTAFRGTAWCLAACRMPPAGCAQRPAVALWPARSQSAKVHSGDQADAASEMRPEALSLSAPVAMVFRPHPEAAGQDVLADAASRTRLEMWSGPLRLQAHDQPVAASLPAPGVTVLHLHQEAVALKLPADATDLARAASLVVRPVLVPAPRSGSLRPFAQLTAAMQVRSPEPQCERLQCQELQFPEWEIQGRVRRGACVPTVSPGQRAESPALPQARSVSGRSDW